MTDSLKNRTHGRIPSDAQLDSLLQEFFRLEVPHELSQPLKRPLVAHSPGFRTDLRARRIAVISTLCALGLLMMLVVSPPGGNPESSSTAGTSETVTKPADQLMLVSPKAGTDRRSQAVGDDGVTLEETDSIEIKSSPR